MADISKTRRYDIESSRLRKGLEALADEMTKKLGIKCRWEGDTCHLSGSGIKRGKLTLTPDTVSIELTLGMMAKMLKGKIEKEIDERIEKLLS